MSDAFYTSDALRVALTVHDPHRCHVVAKTGFCCILLVYDSVHEK